jgi:hypothetical protein
MNSGERHVDLRAERVEGGLIIRTPFERVNNFIDIDVGSVSRVPIPRVTDARNG